MLEKLKLLIASPRARLVVVFLAGLVAGAALSPWRYAFISQTPSGVSFLFRTDRLTGRTELSIYGREWKSINEPSARNAIYYATNPEISEEWKAGKDVPMFRR